MRFKFVCVCEAARLKEEEGCVGERVEDGAAVVLDVAVVRLESQTCVSG